VDAQFQERDPQANHLMVAYRVEELERSHQWSDDQLKPKVHRMMPSPAEHSCKKPITQQPDSHEDHAESHGQAIADS
jgi:hypothetical protein